jgi:hypothetical protein
VSVSPDFDRVGDLLQGVHRVPGPSTGDGGEPLPVAPPPTGPQSLESGRPGPRSPRADAARLLAVVWQEAVGPDVAANARPVQLRQGRLVVSASSSAWAQTLQLMSEAIVTRLNERLGAGTVEQAVFRHAGWEEEPRRRPGPRSGEPTLGTRSPAMGSPGGSAAGPLNEEQEAALAAVDGLDVSPELREKMKRAMRAAFVRTEQGSVR